MWLSYDSSHEIRVAKIGPTSFRRPLQPFRNPPIRLRPCRAETFELRLFYGCGGLGFELRQLGPLGISLHITYFISDYFMI